MSPTHLDQPFKGRLCAKAGLERPLVAIHTHTSGSEAGPPQGEGGFWAEASTSQLGAVKTPHMLFGRQKLPSKAE